MELKRRAYGEKCNPSMLPAKQSTKRFRAREHKQTDLSSYSFQNFESIPICLYSTTKHHP